MYAGIAAAEADPTVHKTGQQVRAVTIDALLAFAVVMSIVDVQKRLRAASFTVDDYVLAKNDPDVLRRTTVAAKRVALLLLNPGPDTTTIVTAPGQVPAAASTTEIS